MGGHGKSRKNVKKGQKAAVRESGDCGCGTSGSHRPHRPRVNADLQGRVSVGSMQKKMLSIVPPRLEISVTELAVNVHHENRVLIGTFCVEPFVINCVHTVLEDRFGNTVRVLIDDDGVITSIHKSKALARYAKGRNVRIFEPYYKMCVDGGTVVSVDDFRDIIGEPGGEEEKLPLGTSLNNEVPSTPEITPSASTEADSVRSEGNRLFAKQDWKGAILFYSKCIAKCLVLLESSGEVDAHVNASRVSEEDVDLSKTLLLAYSNRSETWLRLQSYDEAQSDASKALAQDAKHVKSLVRNGKGLYELQRYEESCASFSAALQESPDDSTIKGALAKSRTSLEQSRDGVYELNEYYISCCSRQPPSCSDFVGNVEIRRPAGGMRGLFATKDVAAGELLLVSNAIAVCHNDKTHGDSDDDGCGACEACEHQKSWAHKEFGRKNSRYLDELVGQLDIFTRSSKRRMHQIAALAGAKPLKELPIPSMDLFRPGAMWTPPSSSENLPLDVETMREIVRQNAIDEILNDPRYFMCGDSDQVLSALWLLPSILNHSCCANSETWLVGEAMFVRACRPILAGEELTRSYFGTLKGFERRQEVASRWPFKCKCQRCEWESSIPEPHNKIRKKLCNRVLRFFFEAYATPFAPNLEKLASLVTSVESTIKSVGLEGKFRLWIRASLMDAYIANVHVLVGIPTRRIDAIQTVLDAMVEVGGGLALRPQIATTLLREVKRKFGKASPVFRSAESYVMDIYKPFYGELSKKAFWTLAKMHAGGDGMD